MASYLRPKRGKRATAEAQNIVLKHYLFRLVIVYFVI